METVSAAFGIALSLLSVGGAFESFSDIGLLPKLIVVAIAAGLVVFSAGKRLATYIRPTDQIGLPAADRSKGRFALCSVALAVLCALFVWLGIFLTQRFTLQLQERSNANSSATLLIAPEGSVQSVTIELPPANKHDTCDWHNRSQEPIPPLSAFTVGFDSPTPSLQIDNFVHPQRVEVDCTPPHALRIDLPGRTVLYSSGTLWTTRAVILIIGGLLWLIACFAMWLCSA